MVERVPLVLSGPAPWREDIKQLWTGWARSGVLRPVLWIEPPEAGADDPVGTWLGEAEGASESLYALLARDVHAHAIELVVVHLDPGDADGARMLNEVAATITGEIRARLGGAQQLTRVDCLVPQSAGSKTDGREGSQPLHQAAFDAQADGRVVISPEDRQEPYVTMARDVAGPAMVTHAAHAVATTMGWWWLMPRSPLIERDPLRGQAGEPLVLFGRAAARIRRAPGLVGRVAEDALHARPNPAPDDIHPAAMWPGSVITTAAAELATHHEGVLGFAPQPPSPEPQPHRVTILAAFKALAGFLLGRARGWPRRFLASTRQRVDREVRERVQQMTYGEGSAFTVKEGSARDAGHGFDVSKPSEITIPSAEYEAAAVWQDVRQTAFGLVDGGELPEAVTAPTNGRGDRVVLSQVGYVAPPLQGHDPPPVDPPLRLCDVRRARKLQHDPPSTAFEESGSAQADQEMPGEGDEASSLEADDQASPALAGTASAREDEAASQAEDDPPPPDREEPPSASDGPLGPQPEPSGEWWAQLDSWEERQSATLCGRLAVHVADALERAEGSFETHRQRLQYDLDRDAQEVADAEETADGRFRRWLRRGLLAWLALLAGTVATILTLGLTLLIGAGVVTAVVALGAGGALVAVLRRERARFQARHRLDTTRIRYLDAVSAVWHDALAVARLRSAYDQLLDWIDIISGVVHDPAGTIHHPEAEPLPHLDPPPLALQLVDGDPTDQRREGLAQRARRRACDFGWLSRAYRVGLARCVSDLKERRGLTADDPDPDMDAEVLGPEPARATLRQDVLTGRHGEAWQRELLDTVRAMLEELPVDDVLDRRVDDGTRGGGLAAFDDLRQGDMMPAGFSNELVNAQGRVDGADRVAEVRTYGAANGEPGAPPVTLHAGVSASPPASQPLQFGVFRVDLSPPLSLDMVDVAAEGVAEPPGVTDPSEDADTDPFL